MFRFALPVLHVSSSVAAEEFYCGRLGFQREFALRPGGADPCYMGVARDGVRLHLSSFSGDGVSGGVVYLAVDNVDALHAELVAKGVTIDLAPVDQTWGNREMYIKDADGRLRRPAASHPHAPAQPRTSTQSPTQDASLSLLGKKAGGRLRGNTTGGYDDREGV